MTTPTDVPAAPQPPQDDPTIWRVDAVLWAEIQPLLVTDGHGVPLATVLSGANRMEMKKLAALLDATVSEAPPPDERHLCLDRGHEVPCRTRAGLPVWQSPNPGVDRKPSPRRRTS